MSVSVTLDGFDKFLTICDPERFAREIDAAVQKAAQYLRDDIKKMPPVNSQRTGYAQPGIPVAPKYGGTLRQSISSRRAGLMAADVYVGPTAEGYGGYVHDGTSKMPARPFFKWELENFRGLQAVEIIIHAALERVVSP